MFIKFKTTLLIAIGFFVAIQLTGCVFLDRDRHGHPWHHDHESHDHDSSVDIRIHG